MKVAMMALAILLAGCRLDNSPQGLLGVDSRTLEKRLGKPLFETMIFNGDDVLQVYCLQGTFTGGQFDESLNAYVSAKSTMSLGNFTTGPCHLQNQATLFVQVRSQSVSAAGYSYPLEQNRIRGWSAELDRLIAGTTLDSDFKSSEIANPEPVGDLTIKQFVAPGGQLSILSKGANGYTLWNYRKERVRTSRLLNFMVHF